MNYGLPAPGGVLGPEVENCDNGYTTILSTIVLRTRWGTTKHTLKSVDVKTACIRVGHEDSRVDGALASGLAKEALGSSPVRVPIGYGPGTLLTAGKSPLESVTGKEIISDSYESWHDWP